MGRGRRLPDGSPDFRTLDDPEPEPAPPPKQPDPAPPAEEPIPIPVYVPKSAHDAPVRSLLYIWGGAVIPSRRPVPGAWRRFWTWFLLGWSWEKLD